MHRKKRELLGVALFLVQIILLTIFSIFWLELEKFFVQYMITKR